jgi:hypothetical protein
MRNSSIKNRLFVFFYSICFTSIGQFDYFNWEKETMYSITNLPSSQGGIAVDQYQRVYYINNSDGNNIYWNYGKLLSSSIPAKPNSNLKLIEDNQGTHLFYIRNDNKIGVIEYLFSNGTWSNNNNYSSVENLNSTNSINFENLNQIFYVRASDNKLSNFWRNNQQFGYGPLNNTAPSVANGSNIIVKGNSLFYITTNKNLARLKWNGVSWIVLNLPNSPLANSISVNSKIQFSGDENTFSIFYVNSSGKMSQYYLNTDPNIGSGYSVIGSNSINVKSNSDILVYSYDECRYIGNDNKIYSLFWNGCSWSCNLVSSTETVTNSSLAQINNKVFYFSSGKFNKLSTKSENSGFVYKKKDRLFLNETLFTPIGINYSLSFYSTDNGNNFFIGPNSHYANNLTVPQFTNQSNSYAALDQQLNQIASLVFNSIRFNNIHLYSNPNDNTDPKLYIIYRDPTFWWNQDVYKEVNDQLLNKIFALYDYLLSRAEYYNLKVKFFTGLEFGNLNTNCQNNYSQYLNKFANRYKNNKTIYSYAILQEPDVIGDNQSKFAGKGDICYYINEHYNSIRNVDKNHLVNIALSSSLSAMSFDPSILNVDFLSFHPYPDFNNLSDNTYEKFRRELNWISNIMKQVGKPWIIGETGYPGYALNDNIQQTGNYNDQKKFAEFAMEASFTAGSSGFCWWQYKNVFWGTNDNCCPDPYLTSLVLGINNWLNSENYFGIIAHDGSLKPIVGGNGLTVTSNVFFNYQPNIGCNCVYPSLNYYQASQNPLFTYNGIVKDNNQNPVKNALVVGYNFSLNPVKSQTTFSKSDGSFSLNSNFQVTDVKIYGLGFIPKDYIPNSNNLLIPVLCGQGLKEESINSNILEIENLEIDFSIFPNPTNSFVSLNIHELNDKENLQLEIIDLFGKSVFYEKIDKTDELVFDLTHLKTGVYTIKLSNKSNVYCKKLIIN